MHNVKFSVIVPVYNVECFIQRCVDSIVASQYKDIEIILVDDGSTDNSGRICDEIAKNYVNIIVIHKSNGGLADARNKGLEVASGEYVFFIDSDDWIDDKLFEHTAKLVKDFQPDIIKFGYSRIINSNKLFSEHPALDEGFYDENQMNDIVIPFCLGNGELFNFKRAFIMSACMSVYKLSIIKSYKLAFKSERKILNEDILFNFEYLLKANTAYILHNAYYNYYCREGSLTQSYKTEMYERKCNLFDYFQKLLENNGIMQKYIKHYSQFVVEHTYDCAVMEAQLNKCDCIKRLEIILSNNRLEQAMGNVKDFIKGKKNFLIYYIMKSKSPLLFKYSYLIGKKLNGRGIGN